MDMEAFGGHPRGLESLYVCRHCYFTSNKVVRVNVIEILDPDPEGEGDPEGVLRLNARPTAETENRLLKVEVESLEDLERLARWLRAPIVKDREGNESVIDVRDGVLYFVRRRER
jgi:hypothetical protein